MMETVLFSLMILVLALVFIGAIVLAGWMVLDVVLDEIDTDYKDLWYIRNPHHWTLYVAEEPKSEKTWFYEIRRPSLFKKSIAHKESERSLNDDERQLRGTRYLERKAPFDTRLECETAGRDWLQRVRDDWDLSHHTNTKYARVK